MFPISKQPENLSSESTGEILLKNMLGGISRCDNIKTFSRGINFWGQI